MRLPIRGVLGILLVLCLLGLTEGGEASTLVVSPSGGDFQLIQDAIDEAAANDRVIIQEGSYRENLVIRKPLGLVCVGAVRLSPADDELATITVTGADDVLIYGISIADAGDGIAMESSSGMISECDIAVGRGGVGISIRASHEKSLTISNVTLVGEEAGVGLLVFGDGRTTLLGCSLSGLGTAMIIGGTAKVFASGCLFEGNFDGLSIVSTAEVGLVDNNIQNNFGSGILLSSPPFEWQPGNLTLVSNRIAGNGAWGITSCSTDGSVEAAVPCRISAIGNSLVGNGSGETCPEGLLLLD